jgi:hypothetical protein
MSVSGRALLRSRTGSRIIYLSKVELAVLTCRILLVRKIAARTTACLSATTLSAWYDRNVHITHLKSTSAALFSSIQPHDECS